MTPSTATSYDIYYDKRGNLWDDGRRIYIYDVLNRLTQVWEHHPDHLDVPLYRRNQIAAFTYDGYGRRLTARYDSDGNGSLNNDPIDVYSYDHLWRVRTVTQATPSSSSSSATWTTFVREQWFYHTSDDPHEYKAGADAPVMRRIDANGDGTFETTQHFVTDSQGSVVAVLGDASPLDAGDETLGGKPGEVIAYVHYDSYGTPLICDPADINRDGIVDTADVAAYVAYWQAWMASTSLSDRYKQICDFNKDGDVDTHDDGLGGPNSTTNADFHALCTRVAAITVAHSIPDVKETLGNLPLYCGYWWDADLELYHVRHRVYRPQWGKWIQRDPLGYAAGWNLYEYVGGEPWQYFDSLGLYQEDPYRGTWDRVGSSPRSESSRQLGSNVLHFADVAAESARDAFKGAFTAPFKLAWWGFMNTMRTLGKLMHGDIVGAASVWPNAIKDAYNSIVDGVANFMLVTMVAPEQFSGEQQAEAWGHLFGNVVGTVAAGFVMEGISIVGSGFNAALEEAGGCGGMCFVAGTQLATADGPEAIEDITPGERVLSQTDPSARAEDEPDSHTWCLCHVRMQDQQSGSVYEIDVLKPSSWLIELSSMSASGTEVMYGLEEEGVYGPAQLVGVEECPPIERGEGRVVLAAIRSKSDNVYDLKLSNSNEALHPTGRHRFYSIDRGDWVSTERLRQDEHIKSSSGEAVVEHVERVRGLYPVYNITVQTDHCYYVGQGLVLTHNGCPDPSAKFVHDDYVRKVRGRGATETSFETPWSKGKGLGSRRYDDFDSATRTAFEGNTTPWSQMTKGQLYRKLDQVGSDFTLLRIGRVDRVVWFGTEELPTIGLGGHLGRALRESGIEYWVVPPP